MATAKRRSQRRGSVPKGCQVFGSFAGVTVLGGAFLGNKVSCYVLL
jgi:hypothetical protein